MAERVGFPGKPRERGQQAQKNQEQRGKEAQNTWESLEGEKS